MADNFPTTDVNSELISAGLNPANPSNTYVDFAQNLTRVRQEQQAQEAAIARARELATQSKIDTSDKTAAQAAGLNPLLADSMTPAEAVAYLNIVAQAKGLEIAPEEIDKWAKTLPERVNRQVVESFANRFARETSRAAQPAKYETTDKIKIPDGSTADELGLNADSSDPKIGHVPEDGMYQVLYDNKGNILKFIPGGKEGVDPSIKAGQHGEDQDRKDWKELEKRVDDVIKSSRGNQLSSAVFRANRALNEAASPDVMIPQVLSFIQKDLSGIFQGGVPPVTGAEKEEFETAYQSLNRFVQKYTGFTGFFQTDKGDQREVLIKLISRLRDSTIEVMDGILKSKVEGFRAIIDKDPARWQRLIADKEAAIKGGLSATAQDASDKNKLETTVANIPGVESHTAAPEIDALAGVLKLKKKAPKGN